MHCNHRTLIKLLSCVALSACAAGPLEPIDSPSRQDVEALEQDLSATRCRSDSDCPLPAGPCRLCADGSFVCPEVACVQRRCRLSIPECPAPAYEPCAGKTCGDSCAICDPSDPTCIETTVLKYCQPDGSCSPTLPTCKVDVGGVPCGQNVCGKREFCCNASCGICAPIGGACIQIACEPAQRCDVTGDPPVTTGCDASQTCVLEACTNSIPPHCFGHCQASAL